MMKKWMGFLLVLTLLVGTVSGSWAELPEEAAVAVTEEAEAPVLEETVPEAGEIPAAASVTEVLPADEPVSVEEEIPAADTAPAAEEALPEQEAVLTEEAEPAADAEEPAVPDEATAVQEEPIASAPDEAAAEAPEELILEESEAEETVAEEAQLAGGYPDLAAAIRVSTTGSTVGATITWTITPSGGNKDYAYFYNIFCGNEVVKYGDWQLSPSISWTATKPGNYYVAGYVVDSRWTEIRQSPDGGLVSIASAFQPLSAAVSVNRTTAVIGETITWTITPSGGNRDYAYFYNIFCGNEVVKYGDWQLDPSISWKVTKGGNYYVAAYVVDSRWTEIKQSPDGGLCVVGSSVYNAYVVPDKTSVRSGDLVTWTAGAAGGNGSYLYNFVLYNGGEYKGETGWQVENTISYYLVTPGSVYMVVYVTDTTWASTAVGYQQVATYVQKTPLTILDENATIESTTVKVGGTVDLNVMPTGGTGIYAYQYVAYEYNKSTGRYEYSWESEWSNDSSETVNFWAECMIYVVCNVTDSEGSTASYTFPVITCTKDTPTATVLLRTTLPKTVSHYSGSRVEDMSSVTGFDYQSKYYEYDGHCTVELYFSGKKLYDVNGSGQSRGAYIGWKLYDASGNVIDSGTYISASVKTGETFGGTTTKDYIFNLQPGVYYLEIMNVN